MSGPCKTKYGNSPSHDRAAFSIVDSVKFKEVSILLLVESLHDRCEDLMEDFEFFSQPFMLLRPEF